MVIRPTRRQLTLTFGTLVVPWSAHAGKPLPPTLPVSEGPAYKAGAPLRDDLVEPGLDGTPLVLSGRILDTNGDPLGGAVVDLWEAKMDGQYDLNGYTLRGKVQANRSGEYRVRLLVPRAYATGGGGYRTAHIHVKTSAPEHSLLTTELYVKGEPRNTSDGSYRPALELALSDWRDGKQAKFDFVLRGA